MALQKSVLMRRLFCFPPISHSKGFSCSSMGEEEIKSRFEAWAVEHGKSYKTVEEKEKRFMIFRDKLKSIEEYNSSFHTCCQRRLTKFSDQTWDELRQIYLYPYPKKTNTKTV